ncbi:MAG: hypothetical protein MJ053_03550 [Elusimicrobiaceae bacterium]|nr:hypothetical protein [Elusimicrobiaceae bacterium]
MYKLILKELILLLALFLSTGQVLYAQAVLPPVTKSVAKAQPRLKALYNAELKAKLQKELGLGNINQVPELKKVITKTLQQRVLTSAARFEQIRANLPEIDSRFLSLRLVGGKALSQPIQESPKVLYPQAPFLQTQEQLGLYFLARNNRAQTTWYPRFVAQYKKLANGLRTSNRQKPPSRIR